MSIPRNLSKLAEGANSSGVLGVTFGGTNANNAADARTNLGLGSAATQASTAFATAAQGTLADNAVSALTSNDGSVVISTTGTSKDLSVGVAGSTATLISQVRNETGATLTKGTVVYISGAASNKALVTKALATSDATSAQTYGVVQADISNNNNGGRNQTHAKGSPTLYAKTSPPEVTHSDQIFMSANSQSNAVQKDDLEMTGLPNLKNVKKSDHKAMIQRLTMYNYNMQNNSAVSKKNPLITHVLGGTSTGGSGVSNLQS